MHLKCSCTSTTDASLPDPILWPRAPAGGILRPSPAFHADRKAEPQATERPEPPGATHSPPPGGRAWRGWRGRDVAGGEAGDRLFGRRTEGADCGLCWSVSQARAKSHPDVDPGLTQIDVEFDPKMSGHFSSVAGSGRHSPGDGGFFSK